MSAWHEERVVGSAADFHARPVDRDPAPSVWWFDVERPALVVGSSQSLDRIDLAACSAAGIEIVRRRSGGGGVLLLPGQVVWADVVIPTTHHQWTDDVFRSAWWLGEVWRDALVDVGLTDLDVHRGALVTSPWSPLVCFAGVGGGEVVRNTPGETSTPVTSGAAPGVGAVPTKVVGVSQRRTRRHARFQCAIHRRWSAADHVPLFVEPRPPAEQLDHSAWPVDVEPDVIREAFMGALRRLD